MIGFYVNTLQKLRLIKCFDNKLLAAITLLFCLAFHIQAAPGDLDPTFGTGGWVTTGNNADFVNPAGNLAIQSDVKIVVIKRDAIAGQVRCGNR